MPKRGPNQEKITKILKVLKESGKKEIWIRELSRQAKIPFTTVHYYFHNYLQDEVSIEDMEFGLVKVISLKL